MLMSILRMPILRMLILCIELSFLKMKKKCLVDRKDSNAFLALSASLAAAKEAACFAKDGPAFYYLYHELEEVWRKIHSFQ